VSLTLGVLLASLVGSVHCAGMCGGFVCLYTGTGAPRGLRGLAPHAAYNLGRLASYLSLGAAAGLLGGQADRLGRLAGVSRAAAVVAGVLLVLWASGAIAASAGVRVPGTLAPAWTRRWLGAGLAAMRDRPPVARATATGLLTTLLPCGWLYAFVVTAAGAGSPAAGALVMAAFWAGTVPMMLGVGIGAKWGLGALRRRLPALSAAVVLVLGLLTIAGKLRTPSPGAAHHAGAAVLHGDR
jgi:sulfite exporter TauE/SafE